jgi:hypothetical protein
MDSLLDVEELCNHELILVVSQPGVCFVYSSSGQALMTITPQLHANQLRNTRSSNRVSSLLQQSSSSFQIPHVTSLSRNTLQELALQVSERCGHRISNGTVEDKVPSLSKGNKHVFCMEAKPHHKGMTRITILYMVLSNSQAPFSWTAWSH